ncbi:hypothetical protein IKG10_00995 [Candidatus Saccharibacteria bacterium]|nr:hypothetical protein [Candidatus Saccharibacteria bacterium]
MKEYTVTKVAVAMAVFLMSAVAALILLWRSNLALCAMFVAMLGILACLVLLSIVQRLHKKIDEDLFALDVAIVLVLISYASSSETMVSIIGLSGSEFLAALAVMGTILNLSALVCKIYS